jgi:hypothetical protein
LSWPTIFTGTDLAAAWGSQGFIDEAPIAARGLVNYWGYNTIAFFAPEARYSSNGELGEFKTMYLLTNPISMPSHANAPAEIVSNAVLHILGASGTPNTARFERNYFHLLAGQ